ncbi:MAG: HAD family hydrolase [Lachnospiraceae bacterium]|nr:HAD family hydrolase [Lachnospiraceae bacterium]
MKYKALICDLDGTLLNTLEDLMDSVNFGLENHGMKKITLEQTRRFVGNGVAKLVERAVEKGTSKEEEAEILKDFRSYYDEHSRDKTRPYEGVVEMLEQVKAQGMKLAIVSNKIDPAVNELAKVYFPGLIDVAIGETPDVPKKPAPDMLYKALRQLGIEKEEAVFIGDSDVDVATGLNSGMDMVTVLWGFRDREELEKSGAKWFIEKPEELFKWI